MNTTLVGFISFLQHLLLAVDFLLFHGFALHGPMLSSLNQLQEIETNL